VPHPRPSVPRTLAELHASTAQLIHETKLLRSRRMEQRMERAHARSLSEEHQLEVTSTRRSR
jgi:hypothetical protein